MIRALFLLLLRLYRYLLSPLFGPSCRFEPSCSRYATACVERFGAARGSWLAVKRVCRCHPWNAGGYDPPPEPDAHRMATRDAVARDAVVLDAPFAPLTNPPRWGTPSEGTR